MSRTRSLYPQKQQRRKKRIKLWPIVIFFVLAGYITYAVIRPLPTVQATTLTKGSGIATSTAALNWPPKAQAAVALPGTKIMTTHGTQKPVPIASTAKVITALTVLDKKPLKSGEQGPVITLTDADVALYNNYAAIDGSLVPVSVGEQISEYQMLQAIMLPSANNIADTMAIWAFGSLSAYTTAANAFVKANGMSNTTVAVDASGFSPATTSTAKDLARLGVLAMESPVLSEIVAQPTANLPEAGTVKNVNILLGRNNIVGVKTGNTDEAGGVFISASRVQISGKSVPIVTAVAGSDNLYLALNESLKLVQSAQANFGPVKIVRRGDVVARYNQPWGPSIAAVAAKDLTIIAWRGANIEAQTSLSELSSKQSSSGKVGTIATQSFSGTNESADIILDQPSSSASIFWRLTHPT